MEKLRDPLKGCPWDKKQTLVSIIPHSIEEVYELADEIYDKNYDGIKDELGDLLFQVIYLSQLCKEKNKFDFNDVVESITNKMILRHPHVFQNKKFNNKKDFEEWWEKSKNKKLKGLLENIPKSSPSMLKSNIIQKKVAGVGFEYTNNIHAINKIIEEAKELKKEIKLKNKKKIKEELGDLIFATLDVSRILKLNPELVLSSANKKFVKRWKKIEKYLNKDKKKFNELNINQFNKLWQKAKLK